MRETAKLAMLLAAICAICGAALLSVDKATKARRAETAARREAAAAAALFGLDRGQLSSVERRDDLGAFIVTDPVGGGFAGAAVKCSSPNGYGGEITLLAAFGADGRMIDFTVLDAHETPGLGANIAKPEFHLQFRGRPVGGEWKVRGDGGDIDAVTSATISSRAVCEAIAQGAAKFAGLAAGLRR